MPTQTPREQLKALLMKGLAWSVPAIFTIWLMTVVFGIADHIMGFLTRAILHWFVPEFLHVGPFAGGESPILSFLLLLLLLTVIGAFVSWRYGEAIVRFIEKQVTKVPGIGFIYRSTRKMADFFDNAKANPFERVVVIPYPHRDVYTVAFVAGKTTIVHEDGRKENFLKVVVPNPPTGIQAIVMIPEKLAFDVPMTVPEGLEYYISVGMVSPAELTLRPSDSKSPPALVRPENIVRKPTE